jgi:hypothetical protein
MRKFGHRNASGLFALSLSMWMGLFGSAAFADALDDGWQRTQEADGITTWKREQPGQELPTFRARTVMSASLWELLAVLEDVDRASEWTANCEEMRSLSGSNASRMLVYARMDAPWPVRDRDVITEVTTSYFGWRGLKVGIRSVSRAEVPERDGLVRIPRMVASYTFEAFSSQKTQVAYQIDLDPGGTLPDWLKTLVARDLAHNTLSRLRERVRWARARDLYRSRAGEIELIARARGFGGNERGDSSSTASTQLAQD